MMRINGWKIKYENFIKEKSDQMDIIDENKIKKNELLKVFLKKV